MKDLGFRVNPNNKVVDDVDGILKFIQEKGELRDSLPYDIDGVVIKLDDLEDTISDNTITGVYTIDGMRLSEPRKGINIIRMSDGTVKKIQN